MKLTKSVETFDPKVFEVGKAYYINFNNSKALYACNSVEEKVSFKKIVGIEGDALLDCSITEYNYTTIQDVFPVNFDVNYNEETASWLINAIVKEDEEDEGLQS